MTKSLTSLAVGVISIALLCAGGCGASKRDDGADADATASIAKSAFIEKADAVCKASRERIARGGIAIFRAARSGEKSRHDLETAAVGSLLIPTLTAEVRQIREIGTPVGDEARIGTILAAIEGALEEAHSDPLSYVQAGGHYRPGSYHYGKATRLANEYGLSGCPQG